MTTYIIIGNGVAGNAVAEAIRKHDQDGAISIFSTDAYPFYYVPGLPAFIAGEKDERGPDHPRPGLVCPTPAGPAPGHGDRQHSPGGDDGGDRDGGAATGMTSCSSPPGGRRWCRR